MKSAVFWDIKTQLVPHRRRITSTLKSPAGECYLRFEVFTAVTMKNTVFWDVTPCGFVRIDVWRHVSPPSSGWKESPS
jgi:hypothetical protein